MGEQQTCGALIEVFHQRYAIAGTWEACALPIRKREGGPCIVKIEGSCGKCMSTHLVPCGVDETNSIHDVGFYDGMEDAPETHEYHPGWEHVAPDVFRSDADAMHAATPAEAEEAG